MKRDALLIALFTLNAMLFVSLCTVILQGVISYRLLDLAAPVRLLGWGIAVFATLGALRMRRSKGFLRIAAAIWSLSSIALIAQMGWMRILL